MARENSIQVTAYSNLASASYVELNMAGADEALWNQAVVTDIAARHSKTAAQVLLRWGIQRGTAIVPKSVKTERLIENIDLFDFNLSEEEMKAISGLNKNRRYNDPGNYAEPAFKCFSPIFD